MQEMKHKEIKVFHPIDPYPLAAMSSLKGIYSFVFAWQASARRDFSARLAVQLNKAFYSPKTQHAAER